MSHPPPHTPGMCPAGESNQPPFALQDYAQPTEPHQSGLNNQHLKTRRTQGKCGFMTSLGKEWTYTSSLAAPSHPTLHHSLLSPDVLPSHQKGTLEFVAPGLETCWGPPYPSKRGEGMLGGEKHRCQRACLPTAPQSHMMPWKRILPQLVPGTTFNPKHLMAPLSVREMQS